MVDIIAVAGMNFCVENGDFFGKIARKIYNLLAIAETIKIGYDHELIMSSDGNFNMKSNYYLVVVVREGDFVLE